MLASLAVAGEEIDAEDVLIDEHPLMEQRDVLLGQLGRYGSDLLDRQIGIIEGSTTGGKVIWIRFPARSRPIRRLTDAHAQGDTQHRGKHARDRSDVPVGSEDPQCERGEQDEGDLAGFGTQRIAQHDEDEADDVGSVHAEIAGERGPSHQQHQPRGNG